MINTAELIAQLRHYAVTEGLSSLYTSAFQRAADALAAQTQEIELLQYALDKSAQRKRIKELEADVLEDGKRIEAQVQEIERLRCRELEAEHDAIIEQCAQIAETIKLAAMSPKVHRPMTAREIAAAIRTLHKKL